MRGRGSRLLSLFVFLPFDVVFPCSHVLRGTSALGYDWGSWGERARRCRGATTTRARSPQKGCVRGWCIVWRVVVGLCLIRSGGGLIALQWRQKENALVIKRHGGCCVSLLCPRLPPQRLCVVVCDGTPSFFLFLLLPLSLSLSIYLSIHTHTHTHTFPLLPAPGCCVVCFRAVPAVCPCALASAPE